MDFRNFLVVNLGDVIAVVVVLDGFVVVAVDAVIVFFLLKDLMINLISH